MKLFTVELWDPQKLSKCRLEGHEHARGTRGAWHVIGYSDDVNSLERLFVEAQQSGRAVRFTANIPKLEIHP